MWMLLVTSLIEWGERWQLVGRKHCILNPRKKEERWLLEFSVFPYSLLFCWASPRQKLGYSKNMWKLYLRVGQYQQDEVCLPCQGSPWILKASSELLRQPCPHCPSKLPNEAGLKTQRRERQKKTVLFRHPPSLTLYKPKWNLIGR